MAYGMQITTTDGLQNVRDIRTTRLVYSETLTGSSGSTTLTGFDVDGGFISFQALNGQGLATQNFYNNTSKVFSWNNISGAPNAPTSFLLLAFRFD